MTIVKEITDRFAGRQVFTYREVELYLKARNRVTGISRILSYMKKNGKIYSLRKGIFSFRKDDMLAGFAYAPFYYGLLSAMTIRELWTQNSKPEIMTLKRVTSTKATVFGSKEHMVFVHHVRAQHFFGFSNVNYGKLKLPVSDPEKTLIDLFYYNTKLPIQEYSGLLNAISASKTRLYLKRYDADTEAKVTGFIREYGKAAKSGRLRSPY